MPFVPGFAGRGPGHGTGPDPSDGSHPEKGRDMQIPKEQILRFLEQQGQGSTANQAQNELPDQVDTDQHGDILRRLGIDVGSLPGSTGGGSGGIGGKLGL